MSAAGPSGSLRYPSHVAIIMDGNRRWARREAPGSPARIGHLAGYQALKRLLTFLTTPSELSSHIKVLTVYAFSSENWKRSQVEINDIMELASCVLTRDIIEIASHNIRVKILGDRARLNPNLSKAIDQAEMQTASNTGLTFVIAFNYGGFWDITEGYNRLRQTCPNAGTIREEDVSRMLPSAFLPPVDLLIRSGGEKRISNFLPWHLAYAELYFVDTLWPDFGLDDFREAVCAYNQRSRRFGGNNCRQSAEADTHAY